MRHEGRRYDEREKLFHQQEMMEKNRRHGKRESYPSDRL